MEHVIIAELLRRTERLERRLRFFQSALGLGVLAVVGYACASLPSARAAEAPGILRVRGIVVEDARGRDRIVLGAPVPDPTDAPRVSPAVGMVINDSAGRERFAVGLQETGLVNMGFDGPPGTGDARNRERLTMGADAEGNAFLQFHDRRTLVPFRIYTDEENRAWAEFLNFEFEGGAPARAVRVRTGFSGTDTLRQSMR